jgi:hypothetical protein
MTRFDTRVAGRTPGRGIQAAPARLAVGSAFAVLAALAACSSDQLTVPNYNNPTPAGIAGDPSAAVQLGANGLLFQLRAQHSGFISGAGIMGRESFNYTPTEGRNTTCWLAPTQDATCGAGAAFWNGYYVNTRNAYNFLQTIDGVTLSDAQKEGARGFAQTIEALTLGFVAERGTNGGPVQVMANPLDLAPFVTRDSMYNYIVGRLDGAKTHLAAATAFPFTLNTGFAGFNTPSTFLKFNRALAARYNVERASLKNPACGAAGITCYQQALQNIAESFVTTSDLNVGPQFVYSTASGDLTNGLSKAASPFIVAHPSIKTDAPVRPDGTPDLRYQTKIKTISPALTTGSAVPGIASDQAFKLYPDLTSPIPIIRSEELILLRAEAEWFTGAKVAAIADIDFIRTTSGGLAASGLTPTSTDDTFIAELLLQRRYSLLFEGHRWVDVRRFGLLATLPIDLPGVQGRYQDLVIPQTECLARKGATVPPTC